LREERDDRWGRPGSGRGRERGEGTSARGWAERAAASGPVKLARVRAEPREEAGRARPTRGKRGKRGESWALGEKGERERSPREKRRVGRAA
jgi:hypothetical protein